MMPVKGAYERKLKKVTEMVRFELKIFAFTKMIKDHNEWR